MPFCKDLGSSFIDKLKHKAVRKELIGLCLRVCVQLMSRHIGTLF